MEQKTRLSEKGREACARSGAANLRAWKEGKITPAASNAEARVAAFAKGLRAEFPEPSPIEGGLIESAISSFSNLTLAGSLGCKRLDRLERIHTISVEASRNLWRVLRTLMTLMDSPEHRADAVKRSLAAIPAPTDAERAAAEAEAKRKSDENKQKFAFLEKGYDGPEPSF